MSRRLSIALLLIYTTTLLFTVAAAKGFRDPNTKHHRIVGYGQIRFDGLGPEAWAQRARAWHKAYLGQRHMLMARPSVREAIDLSCATFGHCSSLWSKARCESHLSPFARNTSGASGLFQFLPSTFASTPYRGFSIWSPYANALAAGWMHEHGRGGEWVCQ